MSILFISSTITDRKGKGCRPNWGGSSLSATDVYKSSTKKCELSRSPLVHRSFRHGNLLFYMTLSRVTCTAFGWCKLLLHGV